MSTRSTRDRLAEVLNPSGLSGPLTDRQHDRLDWLWDAHDDPAALQVTYLVYQDLIDAYQHPDRRTGRQLMAALIEKLRRGLPTGLQEVAQLGRPLWHKREQILAFFDKACASHT